MSQDVSRPHTLAVFLRHDTTGREVRCTTTAPSGLTTGVQWVATCVFSEADLLDPGTLSVDRVVVTDRSGKESKVAGQHFRERSRLRLPSAPLRCSTKLDCFDGYHIDV